MSKILLPAFFFSLIVLFVASTTVLAAPTDTYEGKIAAVGEKSVTVISRQGDNFTFSVAADCKITLDGKEVELGMLGIGITARIAATAEGNARTASRIDAKSL